MLRNISKPFKRWAFNRAKIYTFNYGKWICELTRCLKSEVVYGFLSANFLKGSYGKMIDDFNSILYVSIHAFTLTLSFSVSPYHV